MHIRVMEERLQEMQINYISKEMLSGSSTFRQQNGFYQVCLKISTVVISQL